MIHLVLSMEGPGILPGSGEDIMIHLVVVHGGPRDSPGSGEDNMIPFLLSPNNLGEQD